MSAFSTGPGPQQRRFGAYFDSLARAAGHRVRAVAIESYCTGLLLPGDRKSVEPMAARLAPDNVQHMHQFLHHYKAGVIHDPCHHRSVPFHHRQDKVVHSIE